MSEQSVRRHVTPARCVRGRIVLPGDKSISHRYALLGAIADGVTRIDRFSAGQDCASTVACLAQLGVNVEFPSPGTVVLHGRGLGGLRSNDTTLDAGNSGSTLRMISGVLAGHPFTTRLTGDASLRRRPMRRIVVPLERMGARLEHDNGRPPLTIHGTSSLQGIHFVPDVASAQVKSSVLLAGLHANGTTTVSEPALTRDHTERALTAFGIPPLVDGLSVTVQGGRKLAARPLTVPGDASSAAFWAVAATGLPGSEVEMVDVGLNPTRTAFLDVLERAGARIERTSQRIDAGEPIGTVVVSYGTLRPVEIDPAEVPGLIDELPVLAALATFPGCGVKVTGASELRTKESDRITALTAGLRALGAEAEELPDGFHVRGLRPLTGGTAEACNDHRLAMAFAIAALGATGPTTIEGAEAADVSYPGFFETLTTICAGI